MKEIKTVKAIVWKGDLHFLLLKVKNKDIWQFVTGNIERGEGELEAVKRELKEEIGLRANKIENIEKMNFEDEFYEKNHKIISTLFLVEVEENFEVDIDSNPDEEHENFKWLSKNEVLERLGFENQREFFGKIIDCLE